MASLDSVEKLRADNIEWSRSYLWEVKIEDPKGNLGPFKNWVPAIEVRENIATINTFSFDAYLSTYKIPQASTLFDLTITFIDDINLTLHNWLVKWINEEIFNDGRYLTPFADCVKKIFINKLNLKRDLVKSSAYWVFPEGAFYYQGDSNSEVIRLEVNFIIAGTISHSK